MGLQFPWLGYARYQVILDNRFRDCSPPLQDSEPMGEGCGLEMHSFLGLEERKNLDGEQPMQPRFEDL